MRQASLPAMFSGRRIGVAALLALMGCIAHCQPARPAVVPAAHQAEVAHLQEQLSRLDAEQRVACHAQPTSADCKAKTKAHAEARPALMKRIELLTPHVLLAPPPGGNISVRSSHPEAAGAQDPMRSGLGQSGDGAKVNPPATRCFVATAAYGSPYAEEVMLLRHFRDERLLPHAWGRWLVDGYYRLSPPIAEVIADKPALRTAVRAMLQPVVLGIGHPLVAGLILAVALGWCVRSHARARARETRAPC